MMEQMPQLAPGSVGFGPAARGVGGVRASFDGAADYGGAATANDDGTAAAAAAAGWRTGWWWWWWYDHGTG